MNDEKGKLPTTTGGFTINIKPISKPTLKEKSNLFPEEDVERLDKTPPPSKSVKSQIIEQEEESWLQPGLVIRICNRELGGGRYDGLMGIVKRVIDRYGGEIHCEGGDILKLDQDDCINVIPDLEKEGLVLRGDHREKRVLIKNILEKDVEVELSGSSSSRQSHRVLLPKNYVCRHIAIQ